MLRGDLEKTRALSDRSLALLPPEVLCLSGRALFECEVGNFDAAEIHIERMLETMHLSPPGPTVERAIPASFIPVAARITGNVDRLGVAEEVSRTVLSSRSATPLVAMWARTGLALIAVQRGDTALAGEQYEALEPRRDTMLFWIGADRVLGLLAQTMSNLDQALAHFEDALAFCRKAGYRPELAWTCCDYADTLRERGGPGDRAKAMSLLDESLAISSELGMRPLMERVLSRREILGA